MGLEKKSIRSFSHVKTKKLSLGLLAGFFIVPYLIYASLSRPYTSSSPFPIEDSKLQTEFAITSLCSARNVNVVPVSNNIKYRNGVIAAFNYSSTHLEETTRNNLKKQAETKPLCTLDRLSDVCDMSGNIQINGNSSTVLFIDDQRKESWRVKPYARKYDKNCMSRVTEVLVETLSYTLESTKILQCDANHSVPAIVFSTAGYVTNYFHGFTDVLVPIFLTAREFNGEVQFLVADMRTWWMAKFRPIFQKLSNYQIINYNSDGRVHCFPRVIVGLRRHKELGIDPSRSPNNYSMLEFTRFMREAFSLPRDKVTPATISQNPNRRPRLLIISRARTRKFSNVEEISQEAKELGFEVVTSEGQPGITKFSATVNSVDVMLGVHGAGLTNLIFLPTRAVFIQVVPYGKLEWVCKASFKIPAIDMQLKYLEYKVEAQETSLIEEYGLDDPVIKDPDTVHKLGWGAVRDTYLAQNVNINLTRFRPVFKEALRLLKL